MRKIILFLLFTLALFSEPVRINYKEKIWEAINITYNKLVIDSNEEGVIKISGYMNGEIVVEEVYNNTNLKIEFIYGKRYRIVDNKKILVYERVKDDKEIIYYNNGKVLREFIYQDKKDNIYIIKAYDENGNLILNTATQTLSDGLMDYMKTPIFKNLINSSEFGKIIPSKK